MARRSLYLRNLTLFLSAFALTAPTMGCRAFKMSKSTTLFEDSTASSTTSTSTGSSSSSSSTSTSTSGGSNNSNAGGGGGGSSPAITYTLTKPTHVSKHYGSHDSAPRTVSFTHNGSSAQCSHDGGATYASCDSATTLVFTPTDYANGASLKIKFSGAGYSDTVATYSPASDHPGLTFYTCTTTVTSNTSFSSFQTLLNSAAANDVICLASGLMISTASGVSLDIARNGLVIIGTESGRPRFLNTTNNATPFGDSVFLLNSTGITTGVKFINLLIQTTGSSGHGIYATDTGDSFSVHYVSVSTSANSSIGISTYGSLSMSSSTITTSGSNAAAVFVSAPSVVISNSHLMMLDTVGSGTCTFDSYGSTVSISNSSFESLSTGGGGVLRFSSETTATVNNSVIRGHSTTAGWGTVELTPTVGLAFNLTFQNNSFFTGTNSFYVNNTDPSQVTLEGNTIRHWAEGANNVYIFGGSPSGLTLDSTTNSNLACYDNISFSYAGWWPTTITGGTFSTANQTNAGAIGVCP